MTRYHGLAALVTATALLAGCGEGGRSEAPAKDVEEALTRLGVQLDRAPRIDAVGEFLPEDYSPVGPTASLERIDELALVGVRAADPNAPGTFLNGKMSWLEAQDGVTSLMHAPSVDPAWVADTLAPSSFAQTRRALAAANVDADAFDETVVSYVTTNAQTGDSEVWVEVNDDGTSTSPFGSGDAVRVHSQAPVIRDVRAAAIDSDGDGDDDLALAITDGAAFTILFLVNDGTGFALDDEATQVIAPLNPTVSGLSTALTSARLDHDAGEELVLSLIEYVNAGSQTGVARYLVLDDAAHEHAVLATDYVSAFGAGQLRAAVTADVAAGDIDSDGLDEIVLGGLTGYNSSCVEIGTVYLALDDALRGFNRLGEGYREEFWSNCPANGPWRHRWAHVRLADMDGDDRLEVFVGRWFFEDFAEAAPFTTLYAIPQSSFLVSGDFGWLDRSTSAVAAGDFTGDGYAELALYVQNRTQIAFWGQNGTLFEPVVTHPVEFVNAQNPQNAVLLPVNPDNDSQLLRWDRDYKLVFTEPILIAAIAAPPCFQGIGQNLDACTTTYGTAESTTTETEDVYSMTQQVFAGINLDGGPVPSTGYMLKGALERTVSSTIGDSYSLTRSIVYTTGPQQDSVVFLTIPHDQYTYTVVAHPDPAMVGRQVVVSLPRKAITLMAERSFYNASVTEDAVRIDERVFRHTIGKPRSYATTAMRDERIAEFGGLATQVATVGQGAGSTEVGLAVGTAHSEGEALERGFEIECETTLGGFMFGFKVGASKESNTVITSGTETTYSGSVGSIPAEKYGEDRIYGFGLYSYIYEDEASGQQYEVIDYWVE